MWHLNIENNDISTIGAAFDSMSDTNVYMNGNPLLWEEARLGELPVNVYFNGQCATDSDGDGSVDGRDASPDDALTSVDTDETPDGGMRAIALAIRQPVSHSTTMMTMTVLKMLRTPSQ